jgi:cobalt/nickel transport system permease protein
MHIPDGYLSPSTCVALYAAAAPFWAIALRRVKRLLLTRFVPLISLFAAFSFVIMMFNIPLPGGTTGHATGVALAAIVLGPWASILAISVALVIQAFFFGDGGITAIGANCFNIAIVGSLLSWAAYRTIAGSAPLESRRRVVAAGFAGYLAINAAALLTAIEFGIQPMFFRDATGAPLYAPYPLSIALPAMMIGHMTIAGLAEFIVSAGIVAYLQRTQISLLKLTAPGARADDGNSSTWAAARPLWLGLALLMVLTPLGLLAAGTAWGEWGPRDFNAPETRAEIAAASGGAAAPASVPAGLARLASIWTAPMPDYAPAFLKHEAAGYAISAVFGAGLVLLTVLGLTAAAERLAFRGER